MTQIRNTKNGVNGDWFMKEYKKRGISTWLLLLAALLFLALVPAKTADAATAGFKTINGKTYYINADGSKQKGWLTLNKKKYYFDPKTGVQLKGWQRDEKGRKIRYFTSGTGAMVTGFMSDSKGNTRYFNKKTGLLTRGWLTLSGSKYYFTSGNGIMAKGWMTDSQGRKRYFDEETGKMIVGLYKNSKGEAYYFDKSTGYMYTGLQKIGNYYYYFSKTTGVRYQKGFGTVGSNRYYFSMKNGRAATGWLAVNGNQYYFSSKGVMYVSKTATIDGKTYIFDANGIAAEKSASITFTAYDEKNCRNYTLMNEYKIHPGIADGTKSDLDLLAAFCEAEAGDQGEEGMEAVALCVLNRTIKADKEFPSSVRYVIYQGTTFPQYSVVTDGALLKRLNGQFENRELAYSAAQKALIVFNDYVLNNKKRVINGFQTKDFNYMYFMMDSSFWKQPLSFDKVEYEQYKDHIFFVDWV